MSRWHSCNVLQVESEAHRLWQFDARNGAFSLNREHASSVQEPLPVGTVGKSWSALWQPKLNVAWLPPEEVFIRVAQFPASSSEETRAMVELQLEKLSPIPVTQAVWTMRVLQPAAGQPTHAAPTRSDSIPAEPKPAMQTIVVTIVARSVVEDFLGRLEGVGFLADRLELPMIDQLESTAVREDGAWIYPLVSGGNSALAAWWYGGVLHNLALLGLPAGTDRAAGLRDQLLQMAWAGELEGWLASPPSWHLVADAPTAKLWEPALRQGLDQPVELVEPMSVMDQAAATARRAAEADVQTGLLPVEFASKYRQKFVDRLWMRGLLSVLAVYGVGCLIYFIAVGVLSYQADAVQKQVTALGPTYTNVLQLRALCGVLKERKDLTYAALDCWEKTAELMPEGLTLDSLNFSDGRKLTLNGTAPAAQVGSASEFSGKLKKVTVGAPPQGLFDPASSDTFSSRINPGQNLATWSFGLDLKRTEAEAQ